MEHDAFEGFDTARLRLRCLRISDAKSMVALMTPAVSATLASWPSPMEEAMARHRIETSRTAAAQGRMLPLAVLLQKDEIFIGYVGLVLVPELPRRAKLGYWIGEPYQGRGYAREAAVGAVEAAFSSLDAAEVEAAVEVENETSASILRACGLTLVDRRMMPARGGEHMCEIYRRSR